MGPIGMVITPAMGSTRVTGLRVYTANDFPERDPADFLLEGSTDGGSTFATIASGPLSLPDNRNAAGFALDPIADYNQEVGFANAISYTTYRLTFNNVKTNAIANSAQMGEIELLGTTAPPSVILTIAPAGGGEVMLNWPQGTLLYSTNVNGPWTTNAFIVPPYYFTPTGPQQYFRVLVQ
jgi:hypothetical protein